MSLRSELAAEDLPGLPSSLGTSSDVDERIITAARRIVIAHGIDGSSMAAIARAAKVSRPTLYARFSNREAVIRHLLNNEVVGLLDRAYPLPTTVQEFIDTVVATSQHALNSELLTAILEHNPDALVTYQFLRLGKSQRILIRFVRNIIVKLQNAPVTTGEYPIRRGDPGVMATFVLATAQALTLQSRALTPELPTTTTWTHELARILEGYLYQWPSPDTHRQHLTPSVDTQKSAS